MTNDFSGLESSTPITLLREAPFQIGSIEVRPSAREVIGAAGREVIEPRVMQVLVALARAKGEMVSRDDLIAACWEGRIVTDDAINRVIHKIRRLADRAGGFQIETLTKAGYRLVIVGCPDPIARPAQTSPPAVSAAADARSIWQVALRPALLVATIVLFVGCAWTAKSLLPVPPPRVAVLPFEMLSAGQTETTFAKGVFDETLSFLSGAGVEAVSGDELAGLRGPARESAISRLGVAYLVNGTAESDGKQIRVRVHFDNARSHTTLWSGDFSRNAAQPLDLQTEAAAKSADMISLAMFAVEQKSGPSDDATLAAYMRMNDLVRSQDLRVSASLLDTAKDVVEHAPNFAFGRSTLAYAYLWMAHTVPPAQSQEMLQRARDEAERARALDRRDSTAYFVLALLTPPRHYRDVESVLMKGLAADGHPAATVGVLNSVEGTLLRSVGRARESVPYAQRGQSLDPLSAGKNADLAVAYAMADQMEEAQKVLLRIARLGPHHQFTRYFSFLIPALQGDPGRALAILDDQQARPDNFEAAKIDTWRVFLEARKAPSAERAARASRSILNAANAGWIELSFASIMLGTLGDEAAAFDVANRVNANEDPYFLFLPAMNGVRADTRFMTLAQKFGLVEYWQATGNWPDFCSAPDRPYDCEASAKSAISASQGSSHDRAP